MSLREKRQSRDRLIAALGEPVLDQKTGMTLYPCPVCGALLTLSAMKQHISRMAQSEGLKKLHGLIKDDPHNRYFEEHTKVVTVKKRVWKI